MDTSVYNRPFDDQLQPRIWLATMAFFMILQLIETEDADLVTSSVVAFENSNNPFAERKGWVTNCLKLSKKNLFLNDAIRRRASELERQGIKPIDALHLACAEAGKAECFLTCDDKILKRYEEKEMTALNPVGFIFEVTEEERL